MTYNIEISGEAFRKLNQKIAKLQKDAYKITGIDGIKINVRFPDEVKITPEKTEIALAHVADVVEAVTGVSLTALREQSRKAALIDAKRHFVLMVSRVKIRIPLQSLADFLNLKHHTTIMHLRDSGRDLLETDKTFHAVNDAIFTRYMSRD